MIKEFEIFEEIISSIENGFYVEGMTDEVFYRACENLKVNAEIFMAFNPNDAIDFLAEGRLILYRLLTRKNENGFKANKQQQLQLAIIECGLLKLYRFYTELCALVND